MSSLEKLLANRRWWRCDEPFTHFVATEVFVPDFYAALEAELIAVLARGFGEPGDRLRFSRNMPHSDAYGWNFPPDLDGPLSVFYSREWHDMLTLLTSVSGTLDVNGALHHHPRSSRNGFVHRDLSDCWFSSQPRSDGINPMDLERCSYTSGRAAAGIEAREVVRAVTMIFYLANPPWSPGDGGETGLYGSVDHQVQEARVCVAPLNNSILVFKNSPFSYHSFIQNKRAARNSLILWLHTPKAEAVERWGIGSLYNWRGNS